jgi:lysophospholipase L1-like esterase
MASRTDDASIVEAARRLLASAKTIASQAEMGRQVLRALRESDPQATVTPARVRRLLAVQPFIRLEMRTWKGPREKILNRCPVCSTRLERVKNQTLFGGEVTLTLRCPACGYWTGKEKRIPALYVFHYVVSEMKPGSAGQQPL